MKIALSGYGRMGAIIERVAAERGHEVCARFSSETPASAEALQQCEVIIDFSHASALEAIVEAACSQGKNLVIGTTGWDEKRGAVERRCVDAGIGVVYAANFSPGATVAFALARQAAALLTQFGGYAAGVEERHHDKKKDSPSGTARRIAREIEAGSGGSMKPPVAASRVGAEFGYHVAFFDSADDLVEVSHRARSRDGFARGAVIAAEKLLGKRGFFTFEQLIGLK